MGEPRPAKAPGDVSSSLVLREDRPVWNHDLFTFCYIGQPKLEAFKTLSHHWRWQSLF